jgi:glucosamine kinase
VGIAGYDSENDLKWVREVTKIQGIKCLVWQFNDAVIAHTGALLSKPGIIAIAGTGSIVLGVTEMEKLIRNFDFHHYTYTAAERLAYQSVYKIIAGETDQTDEEFVNAVLKYFKSDCLSDLIKFGQGGFIENFQQRNKFFGDLAPVVTEAASCGSRLAQKVCVLAAENMVTGIKLVGACFESDVILTALMGSVANSVFIKNAIYDILSTENNMKYCLVEPVLPPVLGAIITAMRLCDLEIEMTEKIKNNLLKGYEMIKTGDAG